MVDDATLSRETALIYQYVTGFQPVQGNLTHWRGIVSDSVGNTAELDVKIPSNFPYDAPEISLPGSTEHPRANAEGEIVTRTLQNWQENKHVYSVIREAKSIISTGQFQQIKESDLREIKTALNSQVQTLQSQLEAKKQEYTKLKSQSSHQVASSQNINDLIEDSLVEVENEAYALEEAYDNLELKAIDFAMNFVDTRKRYYLIEAAKENI